VRFSRKRQYESAPNFFYKRKRLVITTCIEKQCTRLLNSVIYLGAEYVGLSEQFDHKQYSRIFLNFQKIRRLDLI